MQAKAGELIRGISLQRNSGQIDSEYAKIDHVHDIEPEALKYLTNTTDSNLIDNPEFKHSQRGVPVTGVNQFVFDRWYVGAAGAAVVSHAFSASTPSTDIPTSGLYTVTTVDTSLAAGDYLTLQQGIEGYDFARAFFGTTSAKPVTVSFWAKASLAGTYCVSLRNGGLNRSYIKEYTLAANTWTKVSVTFPGCTDGTWDTTISVSAYLNFTFACGTTYQGSVNSWTSTNTFASSNQVNLAATLNNTFQITHVQLTVGNFDPPFQSKSHIDDLNKCRRYFQRFTAGAKAFTVTYLAIFGASYSSIQPYVIPMRVTPTARWGRTTIGDNNAYSINGAGAVVDPLAVIVDPQSSTHFRVYCTGNYIYFDTVAGIEFSAEI